MKPYLSGQTAYVEENWSEMVQAMEESLQLYLKLVLTYMHINCTLHRSQYFLIYSYREEDDCRLQCDKPFDQKWYVHLSF